MARASAVNVPFLEWISCQGKMMAILVCFQI